MSERFDDQSFDLASLPKFVRDAMKSAASSVPKLEDSVLKHRGSETWPLLMQASVLPTFQPSELTDESHAELAGEILEFAENRHDVDGKLWALQPDVRSIVLGEALQSGEIKRVIDEAVQRFNDPVTRVLQDCVDGRPPTTEGAELPALEAARTAVSMLAGLQSIQVKLPDLAEIDREIELRRLLAQFERMTGYTATTEGTRDRFFGREMDLEKLRSYVDVVESRSAREYLNRAAQAVQRAYSRGTHPMSVFGVGGVGKTTLIAKFMLDHARAAASKFPFAYLDFDRATVSPRNPFALLLEIILQVSAQFPELARATDKLKDAVRAASHQDRTADGESSTQALLPYQRQFREIVDQFLDEQESLLERARPCLLVFDTFELVQYTPADVQLLEHFVRGFSLRSETIWPRLRLVIAGRKQVAMFLGTVELLEIGALTKTGSCEMLRALAADAGKPISEKDAERVVVTVKKALGGKESAGLHPLRLRLIGSLFAEDARETGPDVVELIMHELSDPKALKTGTGRILVDGILIRRILGHVNDTRVRALADPGLVVRRITPEVIRQVMARGSADPATLPGSESSNLIEDDSVAYTPWELTEKEAEDIYAAFEREVSLVENHAGSLRHRQDVRQEMLPLIRMRRPKRFMRLHELAYAHFRERFERDRSDMIAAGEIIYHGLWLGKPVSEIDSYWLDHPSFEPRIDQDEFENVPELADAVTYLRARSGGRLSAAEVRMLPPDVARAWFERRRVSLLKEPEVNEIVDTTREVVGGDFAGLDGRPEIAADVVRVLIRAGRWDAAVSLALRHLDVGFEKLDAASEWQSSMIRSLAAIHAKSAGPERDAEPLARAAWGMQDAVGKAEALSYLTLAGMSEFRYDVDSELVASSGSSVLRSVRNLRMIVLTRPRSMRNFLALYVSQLQRLPRDREAAAAIYELFTSVFGTTSTFRAVKSPKDAAKDQAKYAESLDTCEELLRQERDDLIARLRKTDDLYDAVVEIARFDHKDWVNPLAHGLSRIEVGSTEDKALRKTLDKALRPWSLKDIAPEGTSLPGLALIEYASDRVGLLAIARGITEARASKKRAAKRRESRPTLAKSIEGYPSDVFDIAERLLGWHEQLERYDRGARRGQAMR